jgi:hypothetical protein
VSLLRKTGTGLHVDLEDTTALTRFEGEAYASSARVDEQRAKKPVVGRFYFHMRAAFGKTLQADTFFAKPYQAWQRGLNEHSNGLVRQYFPKSTDFTTVSSDEVRRVESLLNSRPRAVLGFRTPLEVFANPLDAPPVAIAS